MLSRLWNDVATPLWRWWAVAAGIVAFPMAPLLAGRVSGVDDDVHALHLPLYQWVWNRVLSGEAPWWSPSTFAGQNIVGMGQAAIFYPPNAAFGIFDVVFALRWWIVAHFILGATGMFIWAWRAWRCAPGAAVAAVAYGLNGFAILHMVHLNIVIAGAWIPWCLLGIDLLVDRWSVKRALVLSLPLAFVAIAGLAQLLWLTLLACSIYTAVRLAHRGVGLWPWLRIGGATALGLGLAAVHLVPHYLFSRTSVRPSLTREEAFSYSAQPRDLLTYVLPQIMGGSDGALGSSGPWRGDWPMHEVANHTGIVVVALAFVAAAFAWRTDRLIAAGLIALFGLLTALGGSTRFGDMVFDLVPMADRFRVWARHGVIVNVAMAFAAAAGVRLVLASDFRRRNRILIGLAVGGFTLSGITLLTDLGGARVDGSDLLRVFVFAGLSLAVLATGVMLVPRHRHAAAVLVVAAVSLNMIVFVSGAPWTDPDKTVAEARSHFDGTAPTHPTDPYQAPGGVNRWMTDNIEFRGVESVRSTAVVNGYDPLIQESFVTATGAYFGGFLTDDRMWSPGWHADVLRVSTFISFPGREPKAQGWRRAGSIGSGWVRWERQPRLPEAYVVGAAYVVSFDAAVAVLAVDDIDLRSQVYVDTDSERVRAAFAGRDEPGQAGAVLGGGLSNQGTARYQVAVERPGALVVSVGWLNGWSATVDGRSVPITRANALVIAVPVKPGDSEVRLEFAPPGLRLGLALTVLSLSVLVGLAMVPSWRRWRSQRSASHQAVSGCASPTSVAAGSTRKSAAAVGSTVSGQLDDDGYRG